MDALELFNHEFFTTINWIEVLEKMPTPPFIPQLDSEEDTKYIEQNFLDISASEIILDDEGLEKQREHILQSQKAAELFKEFSF